MTEQRTTTGGWAKRLAALMTEQRTTTGGWAKRLAVKPMYADICWATASVLVTLAGACLFALLFLHLLLPAQPTPTSPLSSYYLESAFCGILIWVVFFLGKHSFSSIKRIYKDFLDNDVSIRGFIPADLHPMRNLTSFFERTLRSNIKRKTITRNDIDKIATDLQQTKAVIIAYSATSQQATTVWYSILRMLRDESLNIYSREQALEAVGEGLQNDSPQTYAAATARVDDSIARLSAKVASFKDDFAKLRIAKLARPDDAMLAHIMGTTADSAATDALPANIQALKVDLGQNIAYVLKHRQRPSETASNAQAIADGPAQKTLLDESMFTVTEARDRYVRDAQSQYNWRVTFDPNGARDAFLADLTKINDGIMVERRKIEAEILDAGVAESAFLAERFPNNNNADETPAQT